MDTEKNIRERMQQVVERQATSSKSSVLTEEKYNAIKIIC